MNNQRKLDNTSLQPRIGQEFQCVAEKCSLSCCVGWNVALDKETFRQYKKDVDLAQKITKKFMAVVDQVKHLGQLKGTPKESVPCLPPRVFAVSKNLSVRELCLKLVVRFQRKLSFS